MRGKARAIAFVLLASPAFGADVHSVRGILLEVDPAKHSIVVSCDAVPGYMESMAMPFTVPASDNLHALAPGMNVQFDLVQKKHTSYAVHLHVIQVSNYEAEPTEADRLTFLHRTLDPRSATKIVKIGQAVPDFTLTDQERRPTSLSHFKGKVVALTFAYSRCPNPNYCFRLSNNLSLLRRRFHAEIGRDLILITVVIDPDHDQGKALQRFADTWKADPEAWRFLTGSISQVRDAAQLFGMNFWSDEGFLTHTLHTAIIDRHGRLAANVEGNQFTASQLGDLVETVLHGSANQAAASPKPMHK